MRGEAAAPPPARRAYRMQQPRHPSWRGYGEISGAYWTNVKHNAKARGLAVDLTIDEAWAVFVSQGRLCALTKTPLTFAQNYCFGKALQTASLDRIDERYGYTRTNVRWVHKTINLMRAGIPDDEFIEWCQRVVGVPR